MTCASRDLYSPPRPVGGWPGWRLAGALGRRHGRRRTGEPLDAGAPGPSGCAPASAPSGHDRLAYAYAASLLEVALQAEALQAGAIQVQPRAASLDGLVGGEIDALGALAAQAGLRLLRETTQGEPARLHTDPHLLGVALKHLLLRALMGEPTPGHVRVRAELTRGEARITVLSRAPAPPRGGRPEQGGYELDAVERVLARLGGVLVPEPRRAGYLPMTIVLASLCAAPALKAA